LVLLLQQVVAEVEAVIVQVQPQVVQVAVGCTEAVEPQHQGKDMQEAVHQEQLLAPVVAVRVL
jgi:hypothetical protein